MIEFIVRPTQIGVYVNWPVRTKDSHVETNFGKYESISNKCISESDTRTIGSACKTILREGVTQIKSLKLYLVRPSGIYRI